MKGDDMSSKTLDAERLAELAKLEAMQDADVDTADIPEASEESWRHARRGDLYRPVKQPVTIRLDADVIAWFKEHAESGGYQTAINRVLREHVVDAEKKRA
jgi:uncharacterized protein (DUF4415 family)